MKQDNPRLGEHLGFDLNEVVGSPEGRFRSWTRSSWEISV